MLGVPADRQPQMSEVVASKHSLRLFRKLCKHEDLTAKGFLGSHPGMQLVVVSNTLLYRHLALTRVSEDDRAVEIGCSYGHCTALLPCASALGIDHAPEKVEEAGRTYPHCRFLCGDVFGEDLSWLDRDPTVLFVDIGGGRNYKPVMQAVAICISHMPCLQLVVVKSIETWNFLLRFEGAVDTVARDLARPTDDEAETAEELAIDIRRRGGEVPVSLLHLLRCGPRLRYLVGKQRMLSFLRGQAPLLQLVEVGYGLPDRRLRVRAAAGATAGPPAYAVLAVQQELAKQVGHQLRGGEARPFLAVFGRLQRRTCKRFMSVVADPELYRQVADDSSDECRAEPWSDEWQSLVAIRHVHAFLCSSPEFAVAGSTVGKVPTAEEIRNHTVRLTGELSEAVAEPSMESMDKGTLGTDGQRIVLQLLDSNWRTGEDGTPEVQNLNVEHAWLLAGGEVVKQLT